jgi:large subunit ribosomal protein L25
MATTYSFSAVTREDTGKKNGFALRREGKLPAVVYGRGEKSTMVTINDHEIFNIYQKTIGKNAMLTMKLTDAAGKVEEQTVMFKDIQREPVRQTFVHVDFYHVHPEHPLKLKVPIVLTGTAKGVKESGGILEHHARSVQVRCLPKDIPAEIKVDVSNLDVEQALMLGQIQPPAGVTFLADKKLVLAHVSEAPEEEKAPEPVAVEGQQPEVIGEKKEGAEGEPGKEGEAGKEGAKDAAKDSGKAAPKAPAAKPVGKAPTKK